MSCRSGLAVPAPDSPFLCRRPAAISAPFLSSVGYPTRIRFGTLRTRARIAGDGSVEQAEELSFYKLLGIPESGTLPEIKQAYKQLARKYHPDVSPPDRVEEYTERFIRVQEAYETLSDPRRRALYDRDLAKGIPFAFSARRRYRYDEEVMEEKSQWKSKWQVQLSELRKRSMNKDSRANMSWAARMRRQREEMSEESSRGSG